MGATDIVNAGKTAWEVIDGNAGSSEIDTSTASAVPREAAGGMLSAPAGTNKMSRNIVVFRDTDDGVEEVVSAGWTLNWEYGSRYKGGGAYIPNAWITLDRDPELAWGWKLYLSMRVMNPTYGGTEKAPIARLPLVIKKRVRSMGGITDEEETFNWVIYGDGSIETNGH